MKSTNSRAGQFFADALLVCESGKSRTKQIKQATRTVGFEQRFAENGICYLGCTCSMSPRSNFVLPQYKLDKQLYQLRFSSISSPITSF